jgi:hypothetical protein
MSFHSTNCTTKLIKHCFDDSESAQKISSAKTKTTAIAKNVVASFCIEQILVSLKDITFISVSTDGSNHGNEKIFPIIIQYFDFKNGGITTKMLQLDRLPGESAEIISNYLFNFLMKFELMQKCIAFSADNCNTNFGGLKRNGQKNVYNWMPGTYFSQRCITWHRFITI